MSAPDIEMPSSATPGEWKAILAPMLVTAGSAEDIGAYLVITQNTRGEVELRTNMPDADVRRVLLLVMPGGGRG